MALKPCKVCGTLNAEGVDTCLSCGHDPEGSKRPAIFRYAAIAVVVCLAIPMISGLFNWILWQLKPKNPEPNPSQVSLVTVITSSFEFLIVSKYNSSDKICTISKPESPDNSYFASARII